MAPPRSGRPASWPTVQRRSSWIFLSLLTEQVARQTDAVEVVGGGEHVAAPVRERDHVMSWQQRIEFKLRGAIHRGRVLLQVRVRDVLQDDRAAPEDQIGCKQVRALASLE